MRPRPCSRARRERYGSWCASAVVRTGRGGFTRCVAVEVAALRRRTGRAVTGAVVAVLAGRRRAAQIAAVRRAGGPRRARRLQRIADAPAFLVGAAELAVVVVIDLPLEAGLGRGVRPV